MDSMAGYEIRLVFTFPPKGSTLQYKNCVRTSEIILISSLYFILSFYR